MRKVTMVILGVVVATVVLFAQGRPGTFSNLTATGTLAVTGASTLTGATNVVGNFAVNTNKFNVTASSGVTTHGDGAVGAPGISFGSDTDTGIYRIGANDIGIAVGGAKALDVGTSEFGVLTNMQAALGLIVGVPTGGYKGTGTANFAADIYKNNTAYGNPDYVFERWATGKIVKFAANEGASRYTGLRSLSSVEAFARSKYTLPRVAEARAAAKGGTLGVFSGGDAVLASVEESYLYLFDLQRQVTALTATNRELIDEIDELRVAAGLPKKVRR